MLTRLFHPALEFGPRGIDFSPRPVHGELHPLPRLFHLLSHAPRMLLKRMLELIRRAPEGILFHNSPRLLSCLHNTAGSGTRAYSNR